MAYYKYIHFLEHEDSPEYDSAHEAGAAAPFSGIYHCAACGSSVTAAYALPLPAHDHHQYSPQQGRIRWRLVVNRIIGKISEFKQPALPVPKVCERLTPLSFARSFGSSR